MIDLGEVLKAEELREIRFLGKFGFVKSEFLFIL